MQENLNWLKARQSSSFVILNWFPLVLAKTKPWSQFRLAYLSFAERRRHLQGLDKRQSGDPFSLFQYRWRRSVNVNLKRWPLVPLSRKRERVLAFVIVLKWSLFIRSPLELIDLVCASESLLLDEKVVIEVELAFSSLESQRIAEKMAFEWLSVGCAVSWVILIYDHNVSNTS